MSALNKRQVLADRRRAQETELPHLGKRRLVWPDLPEKLAGSRMRMCGVPRGKICHSRALRVVGTGRCGSTWLAKVFQEAEIDVGHECVGEIGTVSQFFHTDHDWYPYIPWATNFPGRKAHVGERLSDFKFGLTAHLVRHPLATEASMRGIFNAMNYYWLEDSGVLSVAYDHRPATERNLRAWLDVVHRCEEISDITITLPQMLEAKTWRMLLKKAKLPRVDMPTVAANNKSSGFKKKTPLTWREVREQFPDLYAPLYHASQKLGLEK